MTKIIYENGIIEGGHILMAKRTKDSYAEIVLTRDARDVPPGCLKLIVTFVSDGKEGVLGKDCFRVESQDLKWAFIARLQQNEVISIKRLKDLNQRFLKYQTTTELEIKQKQFKAIQELKEMAL